MARIPTYPGVRISSPQYPGGIANAEAEGWQSLGDSISRVGRTVYAVEQKQKAEAEAAQQKLDSDQAKVYVARTLAGLRTRLTVEETELKNTIGPGGEGFTPEYLKRFDGFSEEIMQGAPNELAKQALTERLSELRGGYAQGALEFEALAGQMQREKDLLDGVRMGANYLRTHPSEFEAILAEQEGGLSAVADKLPADEEEKLSWTLRNSLATSAVEGEISVSPGLAKKRLASGHWDKYLTPDQKNSFLKAAEAKIKEGNAVAQYQMGKTIENHLASIEDTGRGIPGVSAGRVAATYGNEVAGLKFADAERVAFKVNSAKIEIGAVQSPQERMAMLARYRPDNVTRPGTYAEDREVYERLVTAVQQDAKHLTTDPASWANKDGSIGQLATNTSTATAVETSLARQQHAGLAGHETRVMSKDDAARRVAAIESSTPTEKLDTLAWLEAEYGTHFPQVMTELQTAGLSPWYATIHSVKKTDPHVAEMLTVATTLKKEDVTNRFKASGKGAWSTVETAVEANFDQLVRASSYVQKGRTAHWAQTTDLYALTVGNLVATGQYKNAQDAAKDLYKRSYGQMHVDRTYYLPSTTEDGTSIDTDRAAVDLRRVLQDPKWVESRQLSINATQGLSNVGSSRQNVDRSLIATRGIWANSADGKSLELYVETKGRNLRVYESRPYAKSKLRLDNGDGSYSTEKSATISVDGRHYNVPTIWDGKEHSVDAAIARAKPDIAKGAYKAYESVDAAVSAAKTRSAAGGAVPMRRIPVTISLDDVAKGRIRVGGTPASMYQVPGMLDLMTRPGAN